MYNLMYNVLFQKITKRLKKLMACLGGFILYKMLIPMQQCECHDGNVKIELFKFHGAQKRPVFFVIL
jgi:hypothetical protein